MSVPILHVIDHVGIKHESAGRSGSTWSMFGCDRNPVLDEATMLAPHGFGVLPHGGRIPLLGTPLDGSALGPGWPPEPSATGHRFIWRPDRA